MEMVDDATGRTLSRFYEEETTAAAMDLFARYAKKYGLPQALYSDHDSIYETSLKTSTIEALRGEEPLTQFLSMEQWGHFYLWMTYGLFFLLELLTFIRHNSAIPPKITRLSPVCLCVVSFSF